MRLRAPGIAVVLAALAAPPPSVATPLAPSHRAGYDAARWLLAPAAWAPFFAADAAGRDAFLADLLADPDPATERNELREAVGRRDRLWRAEFLSPLDQRAGALFLYGPPGRRAIPDCAETYRPLEIWSYAAGSLVLFQPHPGASFELWTPERGLRPLYTARMAAWMDDWREMDRRGRAGKRVDRILCPEAEIVQAALEAVSEPAGPRLALAPPADLGAWAASVPAAEVAAPSAPRLAAARLTATFPQARGQRIGARLTIVLPDGSEVGRAALPSGSDGAPAERHILAVDGVVEKGDAIFEEFRARFEQPVREGAPLVLEVERWLRPADDYVVRLRVRDEIGGGEARLESGLIVPAEATATAEIPVPDEAMSALAADLATRAFAGDDGIALIEPHDEVALGLWRAEAVVSGERIAKVVFSVDGTAQFTRTGRPWSAELRLPALPRETVVRAEGFDAAGVLVGSDELVLNQQQGELAVRFVAPAGDRRARPGERLFLRAEVVVPPGRRVERVEFRLGEELIAAPTRPPWETPAVVPAGDLVYASALAFLDDGRRAEALRFLRVPDNFEAVDVQFVELYTSVLDRSSRPVLDLAAEDFAVYEDDRAQRLARFARVDDMPLTVGLVFDVSGSMAASLGEARAAAVGFLREVIDPGDRCFAISFADRPIVRMPRSDDPAAIAAALERLSAEGSTALHDAVVQALYYFRGTRGQRALILLSDGDDTSSAVPFRDALEFARRSGVAIYTIGLDLALTGFSARDKLKELAAETGGRSFFVREASELEGVYAEIERELRSQYLIAYVSDGRGDGFRTVEVRMDPPGLKARTIRGYYP
jgi:Ca-activated chloride channel family protein